MILPLADGTYLEIVEVLDHPASDKAPFGQAVRARSCSAAAGSAGSSRSTTSRPWRSGSAASPSTGNRHRPDGTELRWQPDRHPRPDRRPAAAVLHRVGAPPSCTPAPARTRRTRWRASRSPVTRSGSASGSARPSRRRWRTSRSSGSRRTARPASSPPRCRPRTGSSGSERSRSSVSPGRGAEPEHLAPPRDVRDREPRRRPRRRASRPRCALARRLGRARRCSTSAAGPASTCPASPPTAPPRDRGRAAPRPRGAGPPAYPARCRRRGAAGHRAGPAAAGRVGGRGARAVGVLLRARLRAGAGRAGPRRTPRRHGVRDRQRRHAARRSARGSGGATRPSTPPRSSGSGPRTAGPGRRSTSGGLRLARGPGGAWCASSSTARSPTRSWPGTRAPRWTTR